MHSAILIFFFFFFFNDTATTEIYTLSLHDALPIPVAREPPGQEPTWWPGCNDRYCAATRLAENSLAMAIAPFERASHSTGSSSSRSMTELASSGRSAGQAWALMPDRARSALTRVETRMGVPDAMASMTVAEAVGTAYSVGYVAIRAFDRSSRSIAAGSSPGSSMRDRTSDRT